MNQEMAYTVDKTVSAVEILNSLNDIVYVVDMNGELMNLYGREFVRIGIKNENLLGVGLDGLQ